MRAHLSFAALLLATTACTTGPMEAITPAPSIATPPAMAPVVAPVDTAAEDQRLLHFVDAAFDEAAALSPQTLTSIGIKQNYEKLDDYTDAGAAKVLALAERQLEEMKAQFVYESLSPAGKLTYRLFEKDVGTRREQVKWQSHSFPVTTVYGPASNLPVFLINQHRIDNIADAEAYISRLKETERVMGEVSARIRMQAEQNIIPPKFTFAPVLSDTKKILTGAPFDQNGDNILLGDFKNKVGALQIPDEEKNRLILEAQSALSGPFKRGYETMLATLNAVEPKAKGNDGAWSLPDGDAYYGYTLRNWTTTNLSAEQIHQIGLEEVQGIKNEMEKIKEQVGFQGTLLEFLSHMRDGAAYKYSNDEAGRNQYLKDAKGYIAQALNIAPKYFKRLPKASIEVRPLEEWRLATAPNAFYDPPSQDGSRPGIFYINLSDMSQVLKTGVETLAYHEGVPGHHFEIARQKEMESIPKFRRFGFYGAYTEGWGLYAERLGLEMGFLQDPYSRFGYLNSKLLRAVRLVVDTGLHAKRWTREQAIEFFRQNTTSFERGRTRQVERYISLPGQATSYMIGYLKIMELRNKAQAELGTRFDIRDFHEAILDNGALPLDILEDQVDAYIASRKN